MSEDLYRELQSRIELRMTERQILKQFGLQKKEMLKLLHRPSFRAGLRALVQKKTYNCAEILRICQEPMAQFSPAPDAGWLEFLFADIKHVLYPENFPDVMEPCYLMGKVFYLEVLRVCLTAERDFGGFRMTLHFALATEEEQEKSPTKEEYRRFLSFCENTYLLEFMRIAAEITPFNTQGHIAGVHNVAMYMARQLDQCGLPVDLALMSGAAIAHDVGKYGCRESEARRVPYLHYYYTDLCFKRNQMPQISYIAANHSTWDLELENLSLESLLLIYADFRVKSTRENGVEKIHCYTLADSFAVILGKLDNVDAAKKHRYEKVYAKLKDFEDYMISLGVHTDFSSTKPEPQQRKASALLENEEIIDSYKHMTMEHTIRLMNILTHESSFTNILEAARSERDWKYTRTYLNIFHEYSTYLSPKQKLLTIRFLYELLMHRETDIRAAAANLMGEIIVGYDADYRKEIPEGEMPLVQESSSEEQFAKYIQMILVPDHKITQQHRMWLGYKMETLVTSVLSKCRPEKRPGYLKILQTVYEDQNRDDFTAFIMLNTLERMPLAGCTEEEVETFLQFALHFSDQDDMRIWISSLLMLEKFLIQWPDSQMVSDYARQIMDRIPNLATISLLYPKQLVAERLHMTKEEKKQFAIHNDETRWINSAFLENLRAATPWICKMVNIRFLSDEMKVGHNRQPVHTTTHYVNMMTSSECGDVRHLAGRTLVDAVDYVSDEQRNEIAVEMLKGLEIGETEYAKNIPRYLSEIIVKLRPDEMDEIIRTLGHMLIYGQDSVAAVTLDTVANVLQRYDTFRNRHPEDPEHDARIRRLFGLLLRGMAHPHPEVSREAVFVCGEYIFGSSQIALDQKAKIFADIAKKAHHILRSRTEENLDFLIHSAAFISIYRFLSEYMLDCGPIPFEENVKTAFFPGTFDPFSLSHKGIVNEIRRMGFTVYLAIDEFSWSKKTQPPEIRRSIAMMSTADDPNVFMFPSKIPVNIANHTDLARLRSIFAGKDLYIVAGSDVVKNASAYRKPMVKGSIHEFNHILFRRHGSEYEREGGMQTEDGPQSVITGKVIELSLPVQLEDISSTRIRENVDLNRDISNLVDPMVQNYIYENNLYLREPQYKSQVMTRSINCEIHDILRESDMAEDLWQELSQSILRGREQMKNYLVREKLTIAIVRDEENGGKPIAAAVAGSLKNREMLDEFGSLELASRIRNEAIGKMMILKAIYAPRSSAEKDYTQIVLTELLAYALAKDYTYCVYHGRKEMGEYRETVEEVLQRNGFVRLSEPGAEETVMSVDMHRPIILTKNIETTIKSPLNENTRIKQVIEESHSMLQMALTEFRRGNLVLSFDQAIMFHRLQKKIAELNDVPNYVTKPRRLGAKMCVPFGKALRDSVVPNTVTKTLHTEKIFNANMHGFQIEEYPNYSSLKTQIATIRSFDRDVILVDDLLYKGYRLREINEYLKDSGIRIDRLLLGILTANGRDLAQQYGIPCEGVYNIPNIHSWFVESSLYPFIGGDSVRTRGRGTPGLLTSVNLIMPYVTPAFLANENIGAVYHLSMVCLENARNILKVLEEEYQKEFERNLTLDRLTEVIQSPTCPDKGRFMHYDVNIPASNYIENDIEQLARLEYYSKMELKSENYQKLHLD